MNTETPAVNYIKCAIANSVTNTSTNAANTVSIAILLQTAQAVSLNEQNHKSVHMCLTVVVKKLMLLKT